MIQILSTVNDMLAGAFPLVLLLTGAILHTFAPHHRMIVEERVKDRLMSESEARRQIVLVRWGMPMMTVLGVVLTVLLFCERML